MDKETDFMLAIFMRDWYMKERSKYGYTARENETKKIFDAKIETLNQMIEEKREKLYEEWNEKTM